MYIFLPRLWRCRSFHMGWRKGNTRDKIGSMEINSHRNNGCRCPGCCPPLRLPIDSKDRAAKQWSEPGEPQHNRKRYLPSQRCSDCKDDLHYSSVQFSKSPEDSPYCNIRLAQPRRHKTEESVVYAEVKRPEVKRPEVKRPEVKRPEVKRPEDKRPEDKRPEDKRPEVKRPEVKRPEVKRPEKSAAEDLAA